MLKLTKEDEDYLRDNLRYDPETGELWWTKPFFHRKLDKPVGTINRKGYLSFCNSLPSGKKPYLSCHRVCWFLQHKEWPKLQVDHINGDRSDNRIDNLRVATVQENNRNSKSRTGSSKYKGVSWHVQSLKWQAICSDGIKNRHLGIYTSEEEAARAYDKAARAWHGDYARLNFPEEHEQGATHGYDL